MSEETPSIAAPEQNAIAETGSITARTSRGTIHCITIVGQIEGHMELPAQNKTTKYEHLIPQIAAVEQTDEIDGLLILLNTVGGDVEAGLAIAELIAGMKKPTVSLVLGGGHSIGVPLAVAAKKSFIAVSAAMTIHPVRMNRHDHCCAASVRVSGENSGAHRGFHHLALTHHRRTSAAAYARNRSADRRCRHRDLRQSGRRTRID